MQYTFRVRAVDANDPGAAPDFEFPQDGSIGEIGVAGDNVYQVTVEAASGQDVLRRVDDCAWLSITAQRRTDSGRWCPTQPFSFRSSRRAYASLRGNSVTL